MAIAASALNSVKDAFLSDYEREKKAMNKQIDKELAFSGALAFCKRVRTA
jgi:hypothetical protein